MPFPPLCRRSVRWRPADGAGLEHLDIEVTEAGVVARSVAVGEREGRRFGLSYEIRCDAGWRVRALDIRSTDGGRLSLTSDGAGAWRDADGRARPELSGCIDVDISATPFTNTLPIRRMALAGTRGPAEFSMVWVPADTLEPFVDGQRYTALEAEGRYLYEAADGGFSAELTVDGDGLVLHYPGLFSRMP